MLEEMSGSPQGQAAPQLWPIWGLVMSVELAFQLPFIDPSKQWLEQIAV